MGKDRETKIARTLVEKLRDTEVEDWQGDTFGSANVNGPRAVAHEIRLLGHKVALIDEYHEGYRSDYDNSDNSSKSYHLEVDDIKLKYSGDLVRKLWCHLLEKYYARQEALEKKDENKSRMEHEKKLKNIEQNLTYRKKS